jgi:hypothetical protein
MAPAHVKKQMKAGFQPETGKSYKINEKRQMNQYGEYR